MKTLKQIQEGFFNTSGTGLDYLVEQNIREFKLRETFGESRDITKEDYTISDNGVVYFNDDIVKDYWLLLNTNKSSINIKIGSSMMVSIDDSPNLENLDFIKGPGPLKRINITNSFIKTGVNILELDKISKSYVVNSYISNFGSYNNNSVNISIPSILYGSNKDNNITIKHEYAQHPTNFKTISSKIKNINILYSFDSNLKDNISITNIPSNININLFGSNTNGAKISCDIDKIQYGFKNLTLILSPVFNINNLKKHLISADLKDTEIKLIYTDKYGRTKELPKSYVNILEQVANKRPDIRHLLKNIQ